MPLMQDAPKGSEEYWRVRKRELFSRADVRGLTGAERDAFVYGTLRREGWRPNREKVGSKRAT